MKPSIDISVLNISLLIKEAQNLYLKLQAGLKIGGVYDASRTRYWRVLRLQRKVYARYLRRVILGCLVLYPLMYPDTPETTQV